MLGAHPDDENTAVIAYFARGRHMRPPDFGLTQPLTAGTPRPAAMSIFRCQ